MMNVFVELTLKTIPSGDVLPLLELMINPSDCTVLNYQILKGAITLDQISVVQLKLLIEKYYIQDICFGTEFADPISISTQHAVHEILFIELF